MTKTSGRDKVENKKLSSASSRNRNNKTRRLSVLPFYFLLSTFYFSYSPFVHADSKFPPRVIFADAKLSVLVPENWKLVKEFPFAPLFIKETEKGLPSYMTCDISAPLDTLRAAEDISPDLLKTIAQGDGRYRESGVTIIDQKGSTLVPEKKAWQIHWKRGDAAAAREGYTTYFYFENRLYSLTIESAVENLSWILNDYYACLRSLSFLTRRGQGSLDQTSRGGWWVNQSAGAKIFLSDEWLIGVATDRSVGATQKTEKGHVSFVASVETQTSSDLTIQPADKDTLKRKIIDKGWTVLSQQDIDFQTGKAFETIYQGLQDGQTIRGRDLLYITPKARWLFNVEGDVASFRLVAQDIQELINGIQFF